jgi:16S rRNA (guanine527-N7)-methyltransferase
MKELTPEFLDALSEMGVTLSEQQKEQFVTYYEMLVEKNKVLNLTTVTEFEEVLQKHFLDSLSVCRVLDLDTPKKVIDVGTGAGFPGIPLKIAFPDLEVVLLDSLQKRLTFLEEVTTELGLDNVSFLHARAEDAGKDPAYREQFDFCVSRAVANLSVLSELCLPMVKVGGSFVSYKSGKADEEIAHASRAIRILGGKKARKEHFLLPGSDMERILVVVEKKEPTPKNFPRKAGIPAKKPIAS